MSDPTDLLAYDELSARLKRRIRLALVREDDLMKMLDVVYRRTDEIASIAQEVARGDARRATSTSRTWRPTKGSPDAPVIRLIQPCFRTPCRCAPPTCTSSRRNRAARAAARGWQSAGAEYRRPPGRGALVSRLKLMSGLDIAEKRLPQDGRFSVKIGGKSIDVRVATMPTQFGESVVLRLLDQAADLMSLEELGMPAAARAVPRPDRAQRRHGAGHRTDRQWQDHDPVFSAQPSESRRHEDHHGRGPGRVPARPHQSGAGATRRSAWISRACCAPHCARIRTSSWSARCATRKRSISACGPRSPATWCSRRCTP